MDNVFMILLRSNWKLFAFLLTSSMKTWRLIESLSLIFSTIILTNQPPLVRDEIRILLWFPARSNTLSLLEVS